MTRLKDWNQILQEAQDNYLFAFDYSGTNITYMGRAKEGTSKADPRWQVRSFSYDGNNNITDIQWANGDDSFNNVWNDRASLSYS